MSALLQGDRRWRIAAMLVGALASLPAAAAEYALAPGQQVVGGPAAYAIRQGDVLPDIARRFDVGYTALVAANPGVDPWLPEPGRQITIPASYLLPEGPRQGIVINLAQWRLFYFPPGGGRVETYPLGLGVIGVSTPHGATRVVRKEPNPTWYPPASIRAERPELPRVVPPGPDNPLGAFALHLGWPSYLIHGTNKPDGVGRNVSHGCIRLYPADIERLFREVGVGTPVRVVDQPVAAGWSGDALYVEVYPSKSQTEQIDTERPITPDPARGVRAVVTAAAGPDAGAVDWAAVNEAAWQRTGMPVRVAQKSGPLAGQPAEYGAGQPARFAREQSTDPDPPPPAWTTAPSPYATAASPYYPMVPPASYLQAPSTGYAPERSAGGYRPED